MVVTLLMGLIAGYYIAKKYVTNLNLIVVMHRFRDKEKFEDVYELADSVEVFEFINETYNYPKTYYEFEQLHQAGREYAFEIFLDILDIYSRYLLKVYGVILGISLLIFQQETLYFVLGVALVHVGMHLYLYYVKKHKLGMNLMYIHHMITTDKKVKKLVRSKS